MRLYALCDQDMLDARGVSLEEFIKRAKGHSAEIIQYRNKSGESPFVEKQLKKIRKLYDGILIVNDFIELVSFCDGVHIGQEDLLRINQNKKDAITYLREEFLKDKILGLSTHNELEILEANEFDIDYIGLGAYRTTQTKKDIQSVLGDSLDLLAAQSKHKVAAIGGVRLDDTFKNVTYNVVGSGLLI
ncbi:Thiamin-phosphate pyrophosphorylase [hydrothermal vent metagenome]|uniref:Thiamin-phosphate pyrophosphorylase n=1 Tax=hydrothermal vent metagenome TaxID=652676 RepID=A0A1W1D3P4_9ZZZZ